DGRRQPDDAGPDHDDIVVQSALHAGTVAECVMPCSERIHTGDTHSMSAEYTTFGLAPAMRAGGVLANGDYQVHRDFVDFVVDGRPLLFQLSDLDAVSPLASDIPPAIFTEQVRGLLLEAEAPLPEGRYVIYGCPECADLACGAVTAIIER